MANMIDYVHEHCYDSFSDRPFCPVDSLVLSQLAYLNYSDIVPGPATDSAGISIQEIMSHPNASHLYRNVIEDEKSRKLMNAVADSRRFGSIRLNCFVNDVNQETEKQFSAVSFFLDDDIIYVAYRGTDESIVGWKEDFNMAFLSPVPSQEQAVGYLNDIADKTTGKLRVGGHSKGGNLAVYAAMKCRESVQVRIIVIYSHDGPGFLESVLADSAYGRVCDRIQKTLPQSAVIGMLLQHQESYRVVKSNRFWFFQHDPFSWQTDGTDFIYEEAVINRNIVISKTVNKWMNEIEDDKREKFIDTVYEVILATDAKNLHDLTHTLRDNTSAMIEAIREIDSETKMFIIKTIYALVVQLTKDVSRSNMDKFRQYAERLELRFQQEISELRK